MTDFSVPQRMGWKAFLIFFFKDLKGIMVAVGTFLILSIINSDIDIFNASDLLKVLGIAGLLLVYLLLWTLARYLPKKFYVSDGSLIFTHGLLHRQTTTIPLDRIQTLRTKRGLIYQMLQMRGITFDTLASKTEEIELILDEADWESLIWRIENEERTEKDNNESVPADTPPSRGIFIYFKNKYLIADAFCQNHLKGVAILGAFLLAVLNRISNYIEDVEGYVEDLAYEYADGFALTPLDVLVVFALVYILVMLLWVGKALLVYYDMTATIEDNLLTFSRGLFTRMTNRFSYDKIRTASVKRNYLERHFGLCTLQLRQALFATAKKEEENLRIYSSDDSLLLLKWWLGENYESEETQIVGKSGHGVLIHSALLWSILSMVAAIVLCCVQLYIWTIIPAICLVIALWKGVCAMHRSRIILKETYIEVDNGAFADVRNFVKYEDVEVVRIRRTPFSRWFHRATLTLSTSGSSFTVRSLPESDAELLAEYLLCISTS